MSRSLVTSIGALAAFALVPPVVAQDASGEIVVSGPRLENSGERIGSQPTKMLVSQVSVPTHDLDLRTSYGRSVLDHRVKVAAAEVCYHIDQRSEPSGLVGNPLLEARDCRIEAARSAKVQVSAARWAAG